MVADTLTLLKSRQRSALSLTFESFLLDRESSRCSPKTLEGYRYALGGFSRFLSERHVDSIEQITPSHIRAFLVELAHRGLKDTTQYHHAKSFRAFFKWLVAEGELETNPMERVAMPRLEQRVPAPFEPDEVKRLMKACNRATPTGLRDYAIVLCLLDSGLRAAELTGMKVGDINARTGMVTVLGKGGKQRMVRLGAKTRVAVMRYLANREESELATPLWIAYTLMGHEKGALTVPGLQIMVQRLGRKAGVLPCGPHRFRRTFALWCLRDGMDLYSLKMLMGHSSLVVLQRYLALAGEDVERAHRQHSPVDKLL